MTVKEIQSVIEEKVKDQVTPEHTDTEHYYRYKKTGKLYPSVTTKSGIIAMPYLKNWAAKLTANHIEERVKDGGLIDWDKLKSEAIRQHEEVLEDAGDIGTAGHDSIENYLLDWIDKGERPDDICDYILDDYRDDPRAWAIVRSAEQFLIDRHVTPIAPELRVVSEKHSFAGMLDLLARYGEIKVPGDKNCDHNFLTFSNGQQIDECGYCGRRVKWRLGILDWKTSNSWKHDNYAMQTAAYYQAFREMTDITPDEILIIQLSKTKKDYTIVQLEHRPSAFKAFCDISKVHDWLNDGEDKLSKVDKKEQVKLFDTPTETYKESGGLKEI